MEFHGTSKNVPWNSMEFHGTFWGKIKSSMEFHGIPWNSGVWKKFHGIPWNFGSGQNSMEFHGIPWNHRCCSNVVQKVPWNFGESSMELFDQKVSMSIEKRFWMIFCYVMSNSLELGVRQFRWNQKFHGIPWNLECANFADTSSFMEFHGTMSAPISMTRAVPWNSMEFHGTLGAPISMTRAVPWNSMEFHGT